MLPRRSWRLPIALVGLTIWLALSPSTPSQAGPNASITVLSPSGAPSDRLPEGEDYFTLVLGDPRDMNQRLDLRWQRPNVTNVTVDNGLWSAYGYDGVDLLFFHSAMANLGQTGQDYPVDGSRFSRFSIRAQSSTTTNVSLNYFSTLYGSGWAWSDTLASGGMHTLWGDAALPGEVNRLQLHISGDPFVVDWVRLTDPSTSPVYTVTWTTTDVSQVNIYCDTDTNPAVLDHQIAGGVDAAPGSYSWETGYLAPGTYYVYVQATDQSAAGYSPGPLTIQPAPVVDVAAPSRTSGDDYATVELGNPWDMSDSADVASTSHLSSVSFDGQLHATTTGVDPFVRLSSAGVDTIETDYYKYVTWRFRVEGEPWPNSPVRFDGGSVRWGVVRVLIDTLESDRNTFEDIVPWEGWHTYQMDLSRGDGTFYLDNVSPGPGPGWTGNRSSLRLDFLEPYSSDRWDIHLDYVRLAADPRPDGSQYRVQWEVLQGEPITTTLYYSTDRNAWCEDATFIAQATPTEPPPPPGPFRRYLPLVMTGQNVPPASSHTYTWSSLPGPGEYYVKILADDGLNCTCWTGNAPLVIEP